MKTVTITAAAMLVAGPASAETFRLIHAIGNTEREVARDLSKDECAERKKELAATAVAIGAGGSVTCLPESVFED